MSETLSRAVDTRMNEVKLLSLKNSQPTGEANRENCNSMQCALQMRPMQNSVSTQVKEKLMFLRMLGRVGEKKLVSHWRMSLLFQVDR